MKILIVEDDPLVAEDLADDLGQIHHHVTAVAESYEQALAAIAALVPDLVLVDIELKGRLTGIDLGAKLSEMGIAFIYLTSIQDIPTFFRAKATSPLKNLAKPIDPVNLRNTLLEIENPPAPAPADRITMIADKNGVRKPIDKDHIIYIKAGRTYSDIFFTDGSRHTLSIPMSKTVLKLASKDLVAINRSCHVHIGHIISIEGNEITMSDGEKFLVKLSYRASFNSHLNLL